MNKSCTPLPSSGAPEAKHREYKTHSESFDLSVPTWATDHLSIVVDHDEIMNYEDDGDNDSSPMTVKKDAFMQ